MAEEKLQFVLELATRATGNGAQQVADDMNRIQAAIARTTDKAKVSEIAYYDLGAAIERTRKPLEQVPEANNKVRVSSRNTSMALLELSRGFEDAQYGIRGVLNNIPSLVLSLGGTAGLAGVISIAAVGLSQLSGVFTSTGEKADETKEKVNSLGEKMAALKSSQIEKARTDINAAAEEAKALKQRWTEAQKADDEYTESNISNGEKIRQLAVQIDEMLGQRVDKVREIAKIEAAAEELRAKQAELAVLNQNRKLANIGDDIADMAGKLEKLKAEGAKVLAELQQKVELKRNLEAQVVQANQTAGQQIQPYNMGPGPAANQIDFSARSDAQSLAPSLENRVTLLSKEIEALKEQRKSGDEGIRQVAVSLMALQTSGADIAKAVESNTAKIVQDLDTANAEGKFESIKKRTSELISNIEESFTTIQTTNEQGKAAVERTKTAISDGQLTAKEQAQLSRDMVTLMGLIQTGQATGKESVAAMIAAQKKTNSDMAAITAELNRLGGIVGQLQGK